MVTDARLTDLAKAVGRTHAQAVWGAGLAAIGQIDRIVGDGASVAAYRNSSGAVNGAFRRMHT
jgi:hypothetical protein